MFRKLIAGAWVVAGLLTASILVYGAATPVIPTVTTVRSPGDNSHYPTEAAVRAAVDAGGSSVSSIYSQYTSLNGRVNVSSFAAGITPVEIVSSLPGTGNFVGRTAVLTTDQVLYRWNGTTWTAAVDAAKISGTVADAQIAGLAASKVTGQLTDAQVAALAATKITGKLSHAQFDLISSARLTGQITTTQITDGAISTPKIASGAVTASQIAANTITASQIASGTVTATQIASGTITTSQIASGTIVAGNIAASTITGTQIAAGTIASANIAAGTIQASNIAAGTITGNEIAANTIAAGNIASNAITAGKIATGAIVASDGVIANAAITGAQIANATITDANISSLSADKITAGTITSRTLQTSSSGQRIVVSATTNQAEFYGDRGDGTVELLSRIGVNNGASGYAVGEFGSANSTRTAVFGQGKGTYAGYFNNLATANGTGVQIYSGCSGCVGLSAIANNGTAVTGVGVTGGDFNGTTSPVIIRPSGVTSAPTHSANLGTLWVTSDGVLYINTSGSTTWQKVGAQ